MSITTHTSKFISTPSSVALTGTGAKDDNVPDSLSTSRILYLRTICRAVSLQFACNLDWQLTPVITPVRLRCTEKRVRPKGSNVVGSKLVCTSFSPHVTVSGGHIMGCSAGCKTRSRSSSAGMGCAAMPATSDSAHRLKAKSSLTGFSVHCKATCSIMPQFTESGTPEKCSAAQSGIFSTIAFTASSESGCFARGLRASSRLGH